MNVEELLNYHRKLCNSAQVLMAAKNHDYAGADGADPFRNFAAIEKLGISSTEAGLLIRMTDKLNRLITFVQDGRLVVANEGVEDALLDLINYSVILGAYMQEN